MIRVIILLYFSILLSACATIDGEYIQKSGAEIDYQDADKLIKGSSTISDAIALLGQPSQRYMAAGGVEVLEYVSVKTRESYERTFGIIYDRKVQSLREALRLTFENGVLSSKEENDVLD